MFFKHISLTFKKVLQIIRKKSSIVMPFLEKIISSKKLPYVIITIYASVLAYLSILRHYTFTDSWDLGTFSQAFWTAKEGMFFLHTTEPFFAKGFPEVLAKLYFATHFSPFLYILLPFFMLAPKPETLLILQSVGLALGGFLFIGWH